VVYSGSADRGYFVDWSGEIFERVIPVQVACVFAGVTRAALRRQRQRRGKFQISDLRIQIEETAEANSRTPRANTAHGEPLKAKAKAKANANANANADPSPLKGIRDDSWGAGGGIRSELVVSCL
jgi:hypothetical protein